MAILGFVFPTPLLRGDVARTTLLTTEQISDLSFLATRVNLLAMVFFVAKHADARARARCTFYTFPHHVSPG